MSIDNKIIARKSNLYGFIQLGLHLSAISIVILLGYFSDNLFVFIPLFLLNGVLFSFLSTTGAIHELVHSTVFKSSFLNKIVYEILCVVTWTNAVKFKVTHFYHHKNFGHQDDTESNLINFSKVKLRVFLLWIFIDWNRLLLVIKYFYYAIVGKVQSEILKKLLQGKEHEFILRERATYFINIMFLFLFLINQEYKLIALITLAPFVCTIFSKILANLQHIKISECESTNLLLRTTSIAINPFFAFFYWNMNYHLEHHLYPGVPFHQLPDLSSKLLASGRITDNRLSLLDAIKKCNY